MDRFVQRNTVARSGACPSCHGMGFHGPLEYMEMSCCTVCGGTGIVSIVDPERRRGEVSKEAVNHPQHYNTGKHEVIDVIEDWKLSFNLGNTVKYIARHEHKEKPVEDLLKAWWYLTREILAIHRYSLAKLAGQLPTIVRYETARDIESEEEAQLP